MAVVILGCALLLKGPNGFLWETFDLVLLLVGLWIQRQGSHRGATPTSRSLGKLRLVATVAAIVAGTILTITLIVLVFSGVREPYLSMIMIGGGFLFFAAIYAAGRLLRRKQGAD